MEKVLEFLKKNVDVQLSLQEVNSKIKLSKNLQHFLSIKPFDGVEQSFYEYVLSFAIAAEKQSPGAGILFIKKILSIKYDDKIFSSKNKHQLVDKLSHLKIDQMIRDMLVLSLDFANSNTTFHIKRTNTSKAYIEYTEGHHFGINSLFDIKGVVRLSKPKIICIDGYVENVGEIHHMLQKVSEDRLDCVLVCRGMSDDVRHTLKVNFERETLRVLPYIASFDLEMCNTLVDIAVVTGNDVVSSLKGQLISSIDLESISNTDFCECSNTHIMISSSKDRLSVSKHAENISKKLEDHPELENYLLPRLRSLNSSCLEFQIPNDMNFAIRSQQLDEGIRTITSAIQKRKNTEEIIETFYSSYKISLERMSFTTVKN